jgi:hypothetical protein
MNKKQELQKYSNFDDVNKKAKRLLGVSVEVSTRKDKKYMIKTPDGKTVHFGFFGMEDFTKHKDTQRLENFKKRNKKWATSPKWSASFLSYHLLW